MPRYNCECLIACVFLFFKFVVVVVSLSCVAYLLLGHRRENKSERNKSEKHKSQNDQKTNCNNNHNNNNNKIENIIRLR